MGLVRFELRIDAVMASLWSLGAKVRERVRRYVLTAHGFDPDATEGARFVVLTPQGDELERFCDWEGTRYVSTRPGLWEATRDGKTGYGRTPAEALLAIHRSTTWHA